MYYIGMNDLPKRKNIRLKEYDYSSNGAYFITICTKDMKCLLSRITVGHDAHIVPKTELTNYGKIVEKHLKLITGINHFVIMPNHIHLIIVKDTDGTMRASCLTTVSSDIRSFKTVVTKEIEKSIWQPRFHDHIIRDDYDYMEHVQYIDENPKKWILGKDEYYI